MPVSYTHLDVYKRQVLLVAGDKTHPEVQGIVGHTRGEVFVFADLAELKAWKEMCIRDRGGRVLPDRLGGQPAGQLCGSVEHHAGAPVSYTHLDVYKRQDRPYLLLEHDHL